MPNTQLRDIHVLIWDFDGTFFRASPAFVRAVIEADYEVVRRHTGWTKEKTIAEFHTIYKVKTPSSTESAAILSGISIPEAAIECERYKDRLQFLVHDDRLVALFERLTGYTHYMLVNGIQEKVTESLERLGVPKTTFAEIVTTEITGVTKPNEKGFRYIMQKTGLPAPAHLMIGDREPVDLAPAKALGMHTCLVWSDVKSTVADVTVSSVYDIQNVLG